MLFLTNLNRLQDINIGSFKSWSYKDFSREFFVPVSFELTMALQATLSNAHCSRCMTTTLRTIQKFSTGVLRREMKVVPISAFADNYMYLLIDEKSKEAAVIDPVNIESIDKAVKEFNVKLTSSLVTHHHWDHACGVTDVADKYNVKIYGGDDRIARLTNKIADNAHFKVGNLDVKCLHTPCHTTGSYCYYISDGSGDEVVFTGDTLFIGGCGRFFEGNAEDMDRALNDVLGSLPSETKIYCGHEYTVNNLKFALSVEPTNENIRKKLVWAQEQRKAGNCTVPSTIGEEKSYNPFMRVRSKSKDLLEATKSTNPIAVMGKLRSMKNDFYS